MELDRMHSESYFCLQRFGDLVPGGGFLINPSPSNDPSNPKLAPLTICAQLGTTITTIPYAPYQLHLLFMSCFASLVAPFGGFFASGFKRAFNIKDFGHSIPGHGGMTDRMDCQYAFFPVTSFCTRLMGLSLQILDGRIHIRLLQ